MKRAYKLHSERPDFGLMTSSLRGSSSIMPRVTPSTWPINKTKQTKTEKHNYHNKMMKSQHWHFVTWAQVRIACIIPSLSLFSLCLFYFNNPLLSVIFMHRCYPDLSMYVLPFCLFCLPAYPQLMALLKKMIWAESRRTGLCWCMRSHQMRAWR